MRILLLVHSLPVGGAEILATELARWLDARGHNVGIGCLDTVGTLGERLRTDGFSVTCYARKPGKDIGLPFRISRHLRRGAFDLIHAHQTTCYVYGLLAALQVGVPILFTEHGRFYADTRSIFRRVFNRTLGARVDAITAVSAKVRESLVSVEGIPRERVEVVYNGVDASRFRNDPVRRLRARRLIGLPVALPVVGTVGRLHPDKNHGLLLGAASILRKEIPELRLVLIGDGLERSRLEAQSRRLAISDRVAFLGERLDVPDLLPGFDVFALTSLTEGTPVTLLEAMASHIPIVSTAVGGIPEIVADGRDALLLKGPIRPNDPDLAQRLAQLLAAPLRDPNLSQRLAANAARRVARDFSLESSFGRYEAIYRRILGGQAASRQAASGS